MGLELQEVEGIRALKVSMDGSEFMRSMRRGIGGEFTRTSTFQRRFRLGYSKSASHDLMV